MSRFKPGQSGNPAGRPKGSGVAGKLRKAIEAEAPQIIEALIAQARGGDVTAARILLDRVLPSLKAETAPVTIPGMDAGSLSERAQAALDAAERGEVAPDTAAALVGAVGGLARIIETSELEQRITALEKQHEKP